MKHWTQANTGDFAYSVSLDFFTQLEDHIEESGISRAEIAKKLNVTPSAVSQILNNPPSNPKIESLVKYARELGLKVAIITYDDADPTNEKGPIFSGVFEQSWKAMGCPRDLSSFAEISNLTVANLVRPVFVRANELVSDEGRVVTEQPDVKVNEAVKNVVKQDAEKFPGGMHGQRAYAQGA
jgi:transcriptional regulator with XRE-family HTH domain